MLSTLWGDSALSLVGRCCCHSYRVGVACLSPYFISRCPNINTEKETELFISKLQWTLKYVIVQMIHYIDIFVTLTDGATCRSTKQLLFIYYCLFCLFVHDFSYHYFFSHIIYQRYLSSDASNSCHALLNIYVLTLTQVVLLTPS